MSTQVGLTHLYKQYKAYPKHIVDMVVVYCDTHRNRDYVPLLLAFWRHTQDKWKCPCQLCEYERNDK